MGYHEKYEQEDAYWCLVHNYWEPHNQHCLHQKELHILLEEINHPLSTLEHIVENAVRHSIIQSGHILHDHLIHKH